MTTHGRPTMSSTARAVRLIAAAALFLAAGLVAELAEHGTRTERWGVWTDVSLLLVSGMAVTVGAARFRRDRRAPVALMTIGSLCWTIGQTSWLVDHDVLDGRWPGPSDGWYLMFPVLVLAGLVVRSAQYARVGRYTLLSDAALLTTATWFLLWELVIAEGVETAALPQSQQVLVALYSFGGVAVASLAGVMLIRQHSPTLCAVFVAGVCLTVADTLAAATWAEPRSWVYVGVVIGRGAAMCAMAVLAVTPSRTSDRYEGRPQLLRLVVVHGPGLLLMLWAIWRYVISGAEANDVTIVLAFVFVVGIAVNQGMRWLENAAYADELRTSLDRLSHTESQLRDLLGDIPEAVLVLDRNGQILEANQSLLELTGRPADQLIGRFFTVLLRDHDHQVVTDMWTVLLDGGDQLSPIFVIDRADGTVVSVEAAARVPVRDVDRVAVTLRDVTDRVTRTQALERAQERFRSAFHGAPIGMALTTVEGGILLDVNEAIEHMLGYPREHLVGRPVGEFTHPDDIGTQRRAREARPTAVDAYVTEQRFIRSDGEVVWTSTSVSLLDDAEHGRVAIGHVEDITEHRRNARRLEWAATHDELTGLPNRAMFTAELLRRVSDSPAGSIAVLFLDLDNFKVINDSLGHAVGDSLLKAMTARLSAVLRDGDMLCRFGGDEFVIMLSDFADEGSPKAMAERLRLEIGRPVVVDGVELFVTGSIGIAIADTQAATADELLRDADAAMYRAKARGRDLVEVFAPGVRHASLLALRTSNELRRGIERDEIVPYYQPIVDLASGVLTGFEVLARWRHPERGLLGADKFLPMAEETGLITEVGANVLRASLVQLGRWRDRGNELSDLTIAVNVSGRQLLSGQFVDTVAEALAEAGVPASSLWLEITETALMSDVKAATVKLRELRSLGLHLSVDDFGTGYSSLTYLKRFPVEAIKVDRSFVNGLGIDPEDSTIVEAVVNLGHSLGLRVVAEGVETPLQLSRLRELRCDSAQGFLFGRPRPAEIIDAEHLVA